MPRQSRSLFRSMLVALMFATMTLLMLTDDRTGEPSRLAFAEASGATERTWLIGAAVILWLGAAATIHRALTDQE